MNQSWQFIIGILISCSVYGQSVDEIKSNREGYLWGEGKETSLKKADQEALAMLISQISTQVESSFTLLREEMSKDGKTNNYKETFESVINTYSNATLKNTERIVIQNEPDAQVFRYIKRTEVTKVFADRKAKIIGFVKSAGTAEKNNQVADALRYYYWALTLLKSHPEGSSIENIDESGQNQLLATWLPMKLNEIFSSVSFSLKAKEKSETLANYTLNIFYKENPVSNFDYCFWDGNNWSNLISAKNGLGIVELYGIASGTEKLKIKAEYLFEGEARIDRELEEVLKQLDPVPFRASYFTIDLSTDTQSVEANKNTPLVFEIKAAPLTEAGNSALYQQNLRSVLNCIKKKDFVSAQQWFTNEGYDVFTKLINYGNAKLIDEKQSLKFIEFEGKTICRAVPMHFNFNTSNKQIIENVVFHFNPEGKIETLSFALTQKALDDIIKKDTWSERDRMILVNFLEHYQTAYALKRIDYIDQIFSDDALIITGKIVKIKPNEANRFKGNSIVQYNRQSKQEYIKNLHHSFASKEYINIKFEESKIRRAGKGGDIYGVQIRQNYFSDNYGDVGYLFLMVDLNNPDEPVIHVRTWQPEIGVNDSIYGLSDFN